jgi:hypothetical protein
MVVKLYAGGIRVLRVLKRDDVIYNDADHAVFGLLKMMTMLMLM